MTISLYKKSVELFAHLKLPKYLSKYFFTANVDAVIDTNV